LWGTEYLGRLVIPPQELGNFEFDEIIILTDMMSDEIFMTLTKAYNIPENKIKKSDDSFIKRTRARFVFRIASLFKQRGIVGDVAEGGVFQGDFAKVINNAFPTSNFYLFDTFSGFDFRDLESDMNHSMRDNNQLHFAETTVDMVLSKLLYPEKAIIKVGYFPESAAEVYTNFVFVNLDFDLYAPTKAGLEFFFPKMVIGGIILVHDYYNSNYDAKRAVDEFCSANGLLPIPIGDVVSVALVKQ
jgi:O-methyltransferase